MAPKQSTRPRTAAQPNDAEKKVQCGTCNSDSWIFAHKWTPGRTCRFCCSPFPKPVARAQSVGKRAAVDVGTAPAGGVEPWLREILQEKLDVAKDRGDGGVARTMQMERKRAAQTEASVAMEEDAKMPVSKEQDDEVKQLLAKVSMEAEQRAYLAGPAAEPKDPKPEDKGKLCVLDTRKILFQNVTSFGHKARTWLFSDQMDYDIMGVAEWRDTAQFGHLPTLQDQEEPVGEQWQ